LIREQSHARRNKHDSRAVGDGFRRATGRWLFREQDADFWKADRDGDNGLSLDEFKTGRPPDKVDELFKSIDQNSDGSISLGEFQTRPAGEE
jgi:hypothetical protein